MIKKLMISFLLLAVTAFYVNAQDRHAPGKGYEHGRGHQVHGNGHGYGHTKDVGAPLDGGLLLVLGGAGVAYYTARKKKENS
jgi:hypothetical protein